MKQITVHKDFKLNNNSFDSIDELLSYVLDFSPEIHYFLEDWFSEKEVILIKTSGSTGIPKSIELQKVQMQHSALATGIFFKLKEKTTALLCLPTVYIAGKMMLVRAITLGWHIDVVEANSNPLKECSKGYDFTAMVPLQLENSMEKLSQIKKLIVGGGGVSNSLQEKLQYISTEIFATYGMTETSTHIAVKKLNNLPTSQEEGAIVSPLREFYKTLPNTTIYRDERSCLVIKNPKISDNVIFTNDVVELISDTQFEWLGRFDNVINSGGIKLHPEKIEEKLAQIIKQRFFVSGVSDEQLGEKLILIVECRRAQVSGFQGVLKNKIQNLKSLSKFEIPKEIYVTNHFIETETKKIQRKRTLDLIKLI